MGAPPIPLDRLRAAHAALHGVAERTPLVPLPSLTECAGAPVALKAEYRQPMGAFKVRGAYTALHRLAPGARARGVVTSSSGNHGQGLALAARHFGVRCVVVMPGNTPQVKVDGVRRFGGEVVFAGAARSPEQQAEAERLAAAEGLAFIPPYDHPDVILGQATCGLEILEDAPDTALIISPVSGGGLLAGTCAAKLALGHPAEVVAVEPEGAAKLSAAMRAGAPTRLASASSIADGLLTPAVGALTWPIIRQVVGTVVTVSEDDLGMAVRWLWREAGLRVEPSGACALAAVLTGRIRPPGPTVVIASGGNVDDRLFDRLVA
ncbi:MAG: threonine/serine dehydratase [Gemmatimonadales bacterium]|nr:threonine/serine dehydratase [Gemmatimonadales bacterium]